MRISIYIFMCLFIILYNNLDRGHRFCMTSSGQLEILEEIDLLMWNMKFNFCISFIKLFLSDKITIIPYTIKNEEISCIGYHIFIFLAVMKSE